jgi:hypothetical protein
MGPAPLVPDAMLASGLSLRRYRWTRPAKPILALKPVTFHYKSDKTNTPQFGLIAEEVAEVNPDLVVRDADGEIWGIAVASGEVQGERIRNSPTY